MRQVHDTGQCWIWLGAISGHGYGKFSRDHLAVHRLSYEFHKGPIPTDHTLDHLCRVRSCVNPNHLEAVTRGENVLRGNGITAENARKTHCKRGHPFAGENLAVRADGERRCRECARITERERYARAHCAPPPD